jgi:putative two-component system response regulator
MAAATDEEAPPVVLLVDDQQIVAKTIQHMLAAIPEIQFHHCADPNEAIATAARVLPSVILQDLVMPGVDGLDLIVAYRAQPSTSQTPLVVLSSEEEPITKAEAFRRGANDYLVKPPQRAELVARVQYHSRTYRLLLKARALNEAEKRQLIAERQADALRARNTLIFGLAKLAESRDTDTGEHLERIAAYCRVLAEQLRTVHDLTDEWIVNLQLASSLHDIGKVGIPDNVLLKPGLLTPEERVVIERHADIGATALDAILARDQDDSLLRMARNIAASHHERWDGKGYPAGLSGEAIPLEARIVSVADVYDALTSKRVYKPALSHKEALDIISKGRETQFDPQIVDALRNCEIVFQHAGLLLHADNLPDGASPPAPFVV